VYEEVLWENEIRSAPLYVLIENESKAILISISASPS
jgi:hypothetical protein